MLTTVVHRLFGRVTASFLMTRVWRRGPMPYPDDQPVLHGSGPDPDRILLLGGALVGGLGVRSYELAIPGHLARKLASRTGRGADVEARGIRLLTAAIAGAELRKRDLQRFDAVVLMLGNGEILTMRPKRLWRRDIRELLATIEEVASDGPPVLIGAVPPFAAAFDVPAFVRRRIAKAIDRMNAETRRACAEWESVTFVPFDNVGPAPEVGSRVVDAYELWAGALVPPIACAIATMEPDLHAHPGTIDEVERQRALDELGVIGADPDAAVDRIVEMARDMLGVSAASLTIIDRDRQWMMSARGIPAADIPRSEAICNTTIQTPGAYLVEDAETDPEFRDAAWVTGVEHIRAYAGYPLEAPGGQRVGALCVMDRAPRRFTRDEVATLRDLALRAQHELWAAAS